MVKVIWTKAALPPCTDHLVVFATWGHLIGVHPWNIRDCGNIILPKQLFLGRPTPVCRRPNGIGLSIYSSVLQGTAVCPTHIYTQAPTGQSDHGTCDIFNNRPHPALLAKVWPSGAVYLFPQSPILSTFLSLPASFITLSRNPLSHNCLRNPLWIKRNSPTIGQSRICLSFPK